MIRRLRLFIILLVSSGAVVVAAAGQAAAHAALTAATPADGAIVAMAPSVLTLSFSEPVSPLLLKLIPPTGKPQTLDRYELRDRSLAIKVPIGLSNGTHVLSWRVVSEDGHPVGGALVFSIGAANIRAPDVDVHADRAVLFLLWATKLGLYLVLFLGVGGAASAVWIAPLPVAARLFSAGLMGMGLGVLPLAVAAQGLDVLGATAASFFDTAVWKAGASSAFGVTVMMAGFSIATGLASIATQGIARIGLAWSALAGVGLALAASGHASAATPQFLMRSAVFIHGVGIAAWTGALFPLWVALRSRNNAALLRFSRRIPLFVGGILLSGLALTVVQVERISAITNTEYGCVLVLKLLWVAVLLGAAVCNRYMLTVKVVGGDIPAKARLRRVIATEIVLGLLIFGTAAMWRFTPPPRVLAQISAQPASAHIHTPKAMVDIRLTPGRVGLASLSLKLLDRSFEALRAREVTVTLSNPVAGIEGIERPAYQAGDGTWRVDEVLVPMPGRWNIEFEILISDFEMLRLSTTVEVKP
jgi:copper transport protein